MRPYFLRSTLTIVAFALFCALFLAQNASAQGDAETGPPRTPPPPTSVQTQAPVENAPSGQDQQQPGGEAPITADPSADDPGRFVFKKAVQEVLVHATVVDQDGHMVTSLRQGDFSIFQNGRAEPITAFRREDVPVALGIVVDNSGSMRDKREKVNQAVVNLIRASNQDDEVFVVNFSQTPYLDQDFTSDVKLLQTALHQGSTRGSTALYDAVVASATHLQNNPRLNKKVLLVVTDGEDNMSRVTLQEAIRKLQPSKGATVYAIGLTDAGLTRRGREELQQLAASTGGVAYFPDSLGDVDTITREIAHDIRSQYTLAFNPKGNPPKTEYQRIRVEAHGPGKTKYTVRTRSGYYPGETMQ